MTSQKNHQSSTDKPRFFYGYIVVAAALCIEIVIWGTFQSFGVFFRSVLTEFAWSRALTAGAFSLCMILSGLLSIVTGRLTDKFGPRIVITVCGLFLGVGYILMPQIGVIWHLYLLYGVIVGLGMSCAWVPLLSTVARWFIKRRSTMTGIILAGMGTGLWIAPLVADRLNNTYGWRTSYLILGIAVLVIVTAAAQFLKRDPAQSSPDSYTSGQSEELKEGTGLSLVESLRTSQFWIFLAVLGCLGFFLLTITVHIVPHAEDLGISTTNAAGILATVGGANILGMVVLGILGDRIGNRKVIAICFALMTAALFWLIPAASVWKLYLFAFVFGLAQGGAAVQESPITASLFGLKEHGVIFGAVGIGFTAGSGLGPIIAGHIFDINGTYQPAFLICAILGLVGFILTLFLKPVRKLSNG